MAKSPYLLRRIKAEGVAQGEVQKFGYTDKHMRYGKI